MEAFPAVTLEEVFGALAFYLANRPEIDTYLAEADRKYEEMHLKSRADNPLLYRRLEQARRSGQIEKNK